jgi:hypothetical protein
MFETVLRRLLKHPRRNWIVITVTCFVLLAVTWPVVDDYTAARDRRRQLEAALASDRQAIAQMTKMEARVQEQMAETAKLAGRVMDEERSERFRGEIVQLVRQSGCRLTRNTLGPAREREWHKNDNFLAVRPVSNKKDQTPFVLRTRQYSLTITGTMGNIVQLLADLSEKDYLIHAAGFTMRQADDEVNSVVLEMELILIELARPVPTRKTA